MQEALSAVFISCLACFPLPCSFQAVHFFRRPSVCVWTHLPWHCIWSKNGQWPFFCTAVSSLVGWPFAAIFGIPIVLEMLFIRAKWMVFILYSSISASLLITLIYLVDSYYYGKNVIAPLNIILYNVFSPHGPTLYGVEPASFYVKNLFLNFNILFPLAIISLPLSFFVYFKGNYKIGKDSKTDIYHCRFLPIFLIYLSAFLWLLIFFKQAHKEERFLFPAYPLILLLSAVTIDLIRQLIPSIISTPFCSLTIVIFFLLSASRCFALHRNFSSMAETYRIFNDYFRNNQQNLNFDHFQDPIRLCIGKEWHRFHSSFFIPESVSDRHGNKRVVELQFLQSEFRGLLPRHYPQGSIPAITRIIPADMNDMNLEEPTRYVTKESCDFIIDTEGSTFTVLEPNYLETGLFKSISQKPYLLAIESHPVFRAFYIPFTEGYLKYGSVNLLERATLESK